MKEDLIKISGEDNLFYDSEDKLYRYRMHCPYCSIVVSDEFMLSQIKKISELKKVTETEAIEMCLKVGIGSIGRRYGLVTYDILGNKDKGGVWEDGTALAARL